MTVIDRRTWLLQTGIAAGLMLSSRTVRGQQGPRAGQLITRQEMPFNAEPPLSRLADNWLTPEELVFVRSHGPVPEIDPAAFRVSIEGLVEKPQNYSVAELRDRFPLTTATAVLTCAGNRRGELSAEKQVPGVQWTAGAIGNVQWTGLRLSDVLKAAGLKAEAKYVWLEGRDEIPDAATSMKAPFGGSISLEKALNDSVAAAGALLATHLNDKPLTIQHGAPLRLIVPGYIGARSVKWLHKITVSDMPSPNRFIAREYKLLYTGGDDEIKTAAPILQYPINSAITSPEPGSKVSGDRTTVRGYALAPGEPGRQIAKVEVSGDGGASWQQAAIQSPRRDFTWVTWSASLPITGDKPVLMVRAVDNTGATQPERVKWNMKGYLNNGWHKVELQRA